MDKVYVPWDEIEAFIYDIDHDFRASKAPCGVYGLPRGGLVLAVMLSHQMNIPLLAAPCEGCIIIDDICDSGESLCHYAINSSGKKSDYYIATYAYKENKYNIVPDMYALEKEDKWIVFPWEMEEFV